MVSIRLLRIAIMAISEAAKNPLARIKRKMTAASKTRFSTIINISPPCLQLEDNGKHGFAVSITRRQRFGMWRSGAEGGAYLLNVNVSIRSGKRKHLLFIAKLEQKATLQTRRLRA
jgi:hypothetical protein